jgi:hypothetical protein
MNLKKLNLGLVALILGFGLVITQSAFTTKQKQTDKLWGRTANGWIEFSATNPETNYECDPDPDICKALYEDGYMPVTGTDEDEGFISVEAEDGILVPKP